MQRTSTTQELPQVTIAPAEEASKPATIWQHVRRLSAEFWLGFMFFWNIRVPWLVRITRPFFLWFAFRYSKVLRDGPMVNARRLLGPDATDAQIEQLRRNVIRGGYSAVYEVGKCLKLTHKQMAERVDEIVGKKNYETGRAGGKGTIMVTAHLGSFELGVAGMLGLNEKIHVVFKRDERSAFERIRSRMRAHLGVIEHPVDNGMRIWFDLREALARNEVVLLQADRVMPGQPGVPVRFMGGHILMPTGPVKLAMATEATILPIFSIRTGRCRARIHVEPPIQVEGTPRRVDGEHPTMLMIACHIEKYVRQYPEQWIQYYRVWLEDQEDYAKPTGAH